MKRFSAPIGRMEPAIIEGLLLREKLIADGTAPEEASRIVSEGLRATWGDDRVREEPWHYYCERCHDSGVVIVQPSYMEQKRLVRLYGANPQHQDYMAQCEPNCRWRDRERDLRRLKDAKAAK